MESWQLLCADGYECVNRPGRPRTIYPTSDRQLTAKSDMWRYISPYTDEPALLRRFADLDMTDEAIASFANKYGFLGFEEIVDFDLSRRYEPLEKWRFSIAEVACAITLYEAWHDFLDTYSLEKIIKIEDDPVHDTSYKLAFKHKQVELHRRFSPPKHIPYDRTRDYAFAAKFVFGVLTTDGLKDAISPKPKLGLDNELRLALEPNTLIGAIWLQVAQMAEHHKVFKRCEYCGAWFEVRGRDSKAASRKWCGGACSQTAYRQRQAEALKLAEDGLEAYEIANRLGSKLITVQGWLEASRQKARA